MARIYRNYYSNKLIQDIPVIVRRRPAYLNKFYIKDFKIKNNINENFFNNKYNVGKDVFFDKDPLPNIYYVNEIRLLPKNKNTIYAYWEIKDDTFNHLRECFEVFEETTLFIYKNDMIYRKITNLPRFGSYYISNIDADQEYKAVIGFENIYGAFFEIATSNVVISPSGKVSDNTNITWGISKYANNKIFMNKYHFDYLPDETVFRQEILDKSIVDHSIIRKDIQENKFDGSSNLGSSNINR